MALKALDIYKLLPKKNCKECGDPTCLTFAMKLAGGKADVDLCPYLDDQAKSVLGATTRPPIRLVRVGVGERFFKIGEETVLYRHEKTFYHPPGIVFRLKDTQTEEEIAAVTRRVRDETFTRVGTDLRFNGVAIENTSGSAEKFAWAVATVEKQQAHLPPVLIAQDPAALAAALVHCGTYRPLLHAAIAENFRDMCALAKRHGCPLVVRAPTLDGLVQLVKDCTAEGVQDLMLDPAPENLGAFIRRSTQIRQLAITRSLPELGYPVYLDATATGLEDAALVLGIVKYASVIVTSPLEAGPAKASLTLRQNIYTDPQKPIQMNPGLYRVGNPGKDAPVLMTVNFSLTFFTLEGYLEASRIPCYMLIVDTEGLSVLTAVAAGKLNETLVRDSLQKFDVGNEVMHRKLIIPGYASPLSGRIEEATGWKVLVGPRDAAEIGEFLHEVWKKQV
ncbi:MULTISPECIES: acetyl-CoA decarbonylase/synthase complex subunit gamma [unclassified Methanoregula]|uniref:acetyl-CoA decarbonylase/synthase complex subunit gamma n=1 Tax=unclassified Methanoregula TaxID=2649730 RepID=UPI0009CC0409|nr:MULTISPECIES: acetyl-CoA decarbonylase/synthase complex subunit gamma [unclassified Methanoregula]OPX63833.1 MAG: Acetyl-CoA decarbonylase/synthase complex subunit gamma [Methanoregula sp. PtaB.Bin085]OPY35236.1 MAG: Acetyl-CoA decarbonylase/synthase complex subunit gamma [Methanoregula sp. PtaU1.Bin006]